MKDLGALATEIAALQAKAKALRNVYQTCRLIGPASIMGAGQGGQPYANLRKVPSPSRAWGRASQFLEVRKFAHFPLALLGLGISPFPPFTRLTEQHPPAYVLHQKMTNQSLRQRFRLSESKTVIAATIDARIIKSDGSVTRSRKYARYLPFWA